MASTETNMKTLLLACALPFLLFGEAAGSDIDVILKKLEAIEARLDGGFKAQSKRMDALESRVANLERPTGRPAPTVPCHRPVCQKYGQWRLVSIGGWLYLVYEETTVCR